MKKFLTIFLSIVLAFTVNAQTITLQNASKGISKGNDLFSGFQATFSFNQIESVTITNTERGTFSALSIEGAYPAGNVGTPQLLQFKKMIQIPVDATPKIVVKNYTVTEYNLNDYNIHTLYPVQPRVPKKIKLSDVPFAYDEKAYNLNEYTNSSIAEVEILGTMRGVIFGMVIVHPIQYNPTTQSIMVYNNIEVEVVFENANYKKTEELYVNTFSVYFKDVYDNAFNKGVSKDFFSDHPDLYKTPVRMLVIANEMFTATLQPWIEWKTKKGFYMDVNYFPTGTTAATIKTFCHNKYNAGASNGTAPTFIVFVGDTPQIPASGLGVAHSYSSSDYHRSTDFYYAEVNGGGDYFPEMYYSRLSATTTQQLANQIEKILYYEKYDFPEPDYLDNVLLIAGADGTWNVPVGQPTINYATTYYYNTDHGYANIHKYLNSYSGCYTNLNNVGFANYTAHGEETGWYDPSFKVSNVSSLQNENKYFIAMGNCCLAADFGYGECYGEALMRAQKKGAVGYIGSAPLSFWHDDLHFGVGAYPGNFGSGTPATPTFENTKTGFYDATFKDADFNTLCSQVFAGNLSVTYAIITSGYTGDTPPLYYWEAYNVLGDGSLMPYNGQGATNNVSHLSVIYIGLDSYEVLAQPGSYVAISKDGVLLGVAVADASGVAMVPITPITSGGDVDIVVTRNQYKPYMVQVPAVAQSGPYVVYNSYEVANGEVLTYISTNEDVNVTLKNVGVETSGALTVTLSCANPQITITPATTTCNPIAPDGTATFSFKATVANDIPDNTTFLADVIVSDGGKSTWSSKMPLKAYAPKFKIEKILVNGEENGNLPKGSVATITTVIKNEGGADAYAAVGSLEILSQYVSPACEEGKRSVYNIPVGESAEFAFYVTTSSDMPYGHEANFTFNLIAQYGLTFSNQFSASYSGSSSYCMPGSSNCSSYNDRITSLILVKNSDQSFLINNTNPQCNSNGYTDYTSTQVEFEPGATYTVKVKTGYQNHRVRGWIDLNGNNVFDDSESLFTISCTTVGTEYTATFTIPQDFAPGSQRFRIRTRDSSTIPEACNTFSYGQTLDYTAVLPELYPRVQNVEAELQGTNIVITWNAPAEGTPVGYNIYRESNKLNATLLTNKTFTETGITSGIYVYEVTAVYTGNKESFTEISNVICNFLTPVLCEMPVALSGTAQGNNAVINWEKPVQIDGNLIGYNVYRNDVKVGEAFEPMREFIDKDLAVGSYTYKVSAKYLHCAESELTNGVIVYIGIDPCESPVDLEVETVNCGAKLTWKEPFNMNGEFSGYNVYRNDELANDEPLTVLEYNDTELANGTYIYKVSAVYVNCNEEFTAEESIDVVCLGVNDFKTSSYKIFPNPAKNELNITGAVAPTSVSIYNLMGQTMFETDQCATNMKISVSSLSAGIYFVKIVAENGSVTKKVVIEN